MQFPDKATTDARPYSVGLLQLPAGVTISGAAVTVSVVSGTDGTPNNMKSGPYAINTDEVLLKNGRFRMPPGSVVSQRLIGGVAGVLYRVRYVLTLSNTDTITKDVLLQVV